MTISLAVRLISLRLLRPLFNVFSVLRQLAQVLQLLKKTGEEDMIDEYGNPVPDSKDRVRKVLIKVSAIQLNYLALPPVAEFLSCHRRNPKAQWFCKQSDNSNKRK